MALAAANIVVELREVVLRDKPALLKAVSPKATVPVLVLPDGQTLEESLDIIDWALNQSEPLTWARKDVSVTDWIRRCDDELKPWLDRYKYADRFPEASPVHYRQQVELHRFKSSSPSGIRATILFSSISTCSQIAGLKGIKISFFPARTSNKTVPPGS